MLPNPTNHEQAYSMLQQHEGLYRQFLAIVVDAFRLGDAEQRAHDQTGVDDISMGKPPIDVLLNYDAYVVAITEIQDLPIAQPIIKQLYSESV